MSNLGYYTLPLSNDYLLLLGRQARACGGIELVTRWLLRAFLNPHDVKASAARVRDLTHHQAVQLMKDVAPARLDTVGPVERLHLELNLGWLDVARDVMRKRNGYLHGFWLPADEESEPGYWDKNQTRLEVNLETLTREVERAEATERSGIDVLRYACEALGVPQTREGIA